MTSSPTSARTRGGAEGAGPQNSSTSQSHGERSLGCPEKEGRLPHWLWVREAEDQGKRGSLRERLSGRDSTEGLAGAAGPSGLALRPTLATLQKAPSTRRPKRGGSPRCPGPGPTWSRPGETPFDLTSHPPPTPAKAAANEEAGRQGPSASACLQRGTSESQLGSALGPKPRPRHQAPPPPHAA